MLQRLTDAFDQLAGCRTYHMIGNHCLYNLPRNKLHEMLQIPPAADGASYYSFSPHPAWRFVVIDAYDISLLGWPDSHPRHLMAEAILEKENPNKVSSSL
jgi:manganese-dependent ADP-ribose/CDP-alcohol diphosphatase